MGLTIKEMLKADYFKDFRVLAGHGGLDKQIQGIAILDAPDGFNWTHGKELILTSGYLYKHNPDLLKNHTKTESFRHISGMGIKLDRYLHEIPEGVQEAFEENNVPLIYIPNQPSWMDIMNQLNVLVMNKNIKQFRMTGISLKDFSNLDYQTRKINKILSEMENEMKFPAMIYDVSTGKTNYSSSNFVNLMGDLKLADLLKPSFDVTDEVLCDNLQMIRYRFTDDRYDRPYSWITIPITVDDTVKAYFVVVEATGLIDYFDQYALRIGFLLLQSSYEQILVAQSVEDSGFKAFIHDIVRGNLTDQRSISKTALDIGLDPSAVHYTVLMANKEKGESALAGEYELRAIINSCVSHLPFRMTILDNHCLFLFESDKTLSPEKNIRLIQKALEDVSKKITAKLGIKEIVFSIFDYPGTIFDIGRNYERCLQTIEMGRLLYPSESFLKYSDLGAFAWLNVQEDEIQMMSMGLKNLVDSPHYKEHLEILKVYLESRMNYSLTAKTLFMHINTVRKRIEEINDLINFDIEDPVNRLKLEILLKIMG